MEQATVNELHESNKTLISEHLANLQRLSSDHGERLTEMHSEHQVVPATLRAGVCVYLLWGRG